MKQELIKKITPIIEDFVNETLKSFSGIEQIRKDAIHKERQYQDLCEEKQKEVDLIKKRKTEDRREADQRITDLESAKESALIKAKGYEELSNSLKAEKKETDENLAKSKIELIRAKDVRAQADKIKEDNDKVKKDYEIKLRNLKTDFDKLDEKQADQAAEDVKLKARENDIFVGESKNSQESMELKDRELKTKTERKEIDRLIKRHNLEQKLKES